ncbi:MAG TPA: hypothetical protein PKM35_07625 [Holophaga sp.]|nr:hypothetical protein [Holophaga sp.]
MRKIATWPLVASLCIASMAAAPKAKPPTVTQLKAQVQRLTEERDDLQRQLDATENLQQELAASLQGRDQARQEATGLRRELDAAKASMKENQSGSEAILEDLRKTKADLAACASDKETLRTQLESAETRAKKQAETMTGPGLPDIVPARALNLGRVTPKVSKVRRGVVVVNVLVSENGEVLDTNLLQGLPGTDVYVQKANDSCLEAAKRLVFDPARSGDGKTKLRVWQAVGFLVN